VAAVLFLTAMLAACSGSGGAATGQELNISFKSDPDPPRSGDNNLEVSVVGSDGKPVDDATVTAQFYMPAMPSMSMPEMRNSFTLQPAGNGAYRGKGQLQMGGTWDVTVNVARNGEKIGSKKLTVIGK
jgi:nitrogen fixation protein FixH